jgi:hypothetical protein
MQQCNKKRIDIEIIVHRDPVTAFIQARWAVVTEFSRSVRHNSNNYRILLKKV